MHSDRSNLTPSACRHGVSHDEPCDHCETHYRLVEAQAEDIGSHEAAHNACEAEAMTPAQQVGCCLASVKEDCTRPPCPCNLDAYSPRMTPGIDPPEWDDPSGEITLA